MFQGRYFEQIQGPAIGSPFSPLVVNCYMEKFKIRAMNTAEFGKDMLMMPLWSQKTSHKEEFLEHLNSLDTHIQFTTEPSTEDRAMP